MGTRPARHVASRELAHSLAATQFLYQFSLNMRQEVEALPPLGNHQQVHKGEGGRAPAAPGS